ncbi:hypothetical protein HWV62_43850 [Athelia sp. TMB]|nr:hypothetical protein HWV62_43850 [Athelia sp. TMB]
MKANGWLVPEMFSVCLDLRVQLWNFHDEDIEKPSFSFAGHRANIMTVAFSASNRYIYSGAADDMIIRYDMTMPTNSLENHKLYTHHNDMIRGLAPHIFNEEIFMSASDDGKIMLHDDRTKPSMTRAQGTLQQNAEITDIKSHPLTESLFATSDSTGRVCLRDIRMAFGPLAQRANEGVVRTVCGLFKLYRQSQFKYKQYNTKLSKNGVGHLSNPETSSINFDRNGSKLAVTMLHFLPTIYSVSDPHPIAVCSAPLPIPSEQDFIPKERGYTNSCTMKHGSFGGPGLAVDSYYATGSDDFRAYVWKIPDPAKLLDGRQVFSADAWAAEASHHIGFTEGLFSPRYVPVDISQPAFRLNGHNSIVNTALIHPSFMHIVTAGVERDIFLHGPAPSSPCTSGLGKTDTNVRNILPMDPEDRERVFRALSAALGQDSDDTDELETIALFDQILRQEGDPDVFDTRHWRPPEGRSDSDAESDPEMAFEQEASSSEDYME